MMNPYLVEWVAAVFQPGTLDLREDGRRMVQVAKVPNGMTLSSQEVDYLIEHLKKISRKDEQ